MSIYSLKNKILKEEEEIIINIGVSFDEFGNPIFYTDNDLIGLITENTFNYPSIKLLSDKKQKVIINLIPNKINGRMMNHGSRIKFKSKSGNDIGTRSLVFDHDNDQNPIPIVSIYSNQDKTKNKFKDNELLKDYMLNTAFSFVQSNPKLIEDYFLGNCNFDDLLNYANEFNKFSNDKKKEYASQIIQRK